MSNFTVKSMFREYPVEVGNGIMRERLRGVVKPGDYLIVDKNVCIPEEWIKEMNLNDRAISIMASEELKSYHGAEGIIDMLIGGGFKRNNKLVAIGGGVVQDLTSFVASILYRGVEWVFCPTTLLSQGDSCIGSKTSINFGKYKNQLGGFYPPSKIFIDTNVLKTLPKGEMLSGLGEMCHYFIIGGRKKFNLFGNLYEEALDGDTGALNILIRESLMIKKEMVERDEFDMGPRNIFNYGHTFGHALETMSEYGISHGVAVAIGMDIANYVSVRLGLADACFYAETHNFLRKIYEGTDLSFLDMDAYVDALKKDKKNEGVNLGLILTRGYGDMFKRMTPCDDDFIGIVNDYMEGEYGP